ncbi:hypothetical protein H5410_041629 [Solanum commersonii]|uniref:DUF4283 domain-containing protein n=1 Tax=Solanum commersonii TaxID=4109 RepID=A0A9J5XS43_SOLCO|nr:hypothetical protein H5410_041629 [Solanum commersonii]
MLPIQKKIPLWITLPCLPVGYWSSEALSKVTSDTGKPLSLTVSLLQWHEFHTLENRKPKQPRYNWKTKGVAKQDEPTTSTLVVDRRKIDEPANITISAQFSLLKFYK